MKTVICDYCKQPIALADPDSMTLPMQPEDFKSLLPRNGVPDPFHPSLEWRHFKCQYCRFRPFEHEDQITTIDDAGKPTRHTIQPPPGHVCPKCGKKYQPKTSLNRHIKECDGS